MRGPTELTGEESDGRYGDMWAAGLLGPVISHPPSHPHQQETLPSDHRKYDCAQINTISYTDPGCSVTSGYKLNSTKLITDSWEFEIYLLMRQTGVRLVVVRRMKLTVFLSC